MQTTTTCILLTINVFCVFQQTLCIRRTYTGSSLKVKEGSQFTLRESCKSNSDVLMAILSIFLMLPSLSLIGV